MPYLLFLWLFVLCSLCLFFFFFFNDTATTEIYTLSHTTLFRSLGLVINGVAALVLAALAARGVAEGSAEHRALRLRVLAAGGVGGLAAGGALRGPGGGCPPVGLRPPTLAPRPPRPPPPPRVLPP